MRINNGHRTLIKFHLTMHNITIYRHYTKFTTTNVPWFTNPVWAVLTVLNKLFETERGRTQHSILDRKASTITMTEDKCKRAIKTLVNEN